MALAGLIACDSDSDAPDQPQPQPQQVTCTISEPTALTEITPGTTVIIAGNGSVNHGSITRVTLTVGDEQIAAVTEVPFSYAVSYTHLTLPTILRV